MRSRLTLLLALPFALFSPSLYAGDAIYELRIYTTNEGKLDDLHARFREHTVDLFTKHGMESLAYWVPVDEPLSKNTLIYVLKHKSRDAAKASWAAFRNDPVWQQAFKASRVDGPLLAKAPESVYLTLTDYSPWPKQDDGTEQQARTVDDDQYELRIYQTNEGKLPLLDKRFAEHTIDLFSKHGIESLWYWHAADEPKSTDHLYYVIRHDSREASKASWKGFAGDPQWKAAAAASGVGRLKQRPTSIYMRTTDYSPLK